MCIKIKLNKSSKCRHSAGVLESNPDSSLVVSQSPININERSVVKGRSAGDDGKEERDFLFPFTFPSSPSHQCLMVSRNRSLTAYKIRDDWGRVSGQIKLEPHPVERLNSNFSTYGHRVFDTTIPSPEIYLSVSTEIFSSTFEIKKNSFLHQR